MIEFWNWMLEWGFPLLVMLAVLQLDNLRKERRKKKQDAEMARIHAEMSAEYRRRNKWRDNP